MRLCITGPTRELVPASFAVDFAQLFAYTRERGPWGTDVIEGFIPSTYIHVGREFCLEASIKSGATHVCWLDTDMGFPREAAVLLAMHEVPFVACNTVMRHPPASGNPLEPQFTARLNDERVQTTAETTGLQVVDEVGFGCVLMRTEIVKTIPRPWFRHGLNHAGGDVGEDIQFCRKLREAGHQVVIDHDLSKSLIHYGLYGYRPACALQTDEVAL